MLALIDIGSTLIDGPPMGPARRIAQSLELPAQAITELEKCLFQTHTESPRQLANIISGRFGCDPAKALRTIEGLWNAQIDEAYILPGVKEALDKLRAAAIPFAFVSNIWPPFFQGFARLLPEYAQETPAFLSYKLGLSKPDQRLYLEALGAMHAQPEDTVMIGDTYKNDIAPAIALGMQTIWVLQRPQKEKPDILDVISGMRQKPTLTVGHFSDITPDILHNELNTLYKNTAGRTARQHCKNQA
jgi:HAD superfamily hydrolase (TIGR01509 family)